MKKIHVLRHSKDGTTCILIRIHKIYYPMNDHIMREIQYIELSITEAIRIMAEIIRQKIRERYNFRQHKTLFPFPLSNAHACPNELFMQLIPHLEKAVSSLHQRTLPKAL